LALNLTGDWDCSINRSWDNWKQKNNCRLFEKIRWKTRRWWIDVSQM